MKTPARAGPGWVAKKDAFDSLLAQSALLRYQTYQADDRRIRQLQPAATWMRDRIVHRYQPGQSNDAVDQYDEALGRADLSGARRA